VSTVIIPFSILDVFYDLKTWIQVGFYLKIQYYYIWKVKNQDQSKTELTKRVISFGQGRIKVFEGPGHLAFCAPWTSTRAKNKRETAPQAKMALWKKIHASY
jgi:hypothetical protein